MTLAKVKPAIQEQALQYVDRNNQELVDELMSKSSKDLVNWMKEREQELKAKKDKEEDDPYHGITRFSTFKTMGQ